MLVPTLFGLGFGATALTTKPAPTVLILILAYALLQRGGALAYTLAIFMGALSATLLGKPLGWRPAFNAQAPRSMMAAVWCATYAAVLWRPEWLVTVAVSQLVEHELMTDEVFYHKSAAYCAMLVLCSMASSSTDAQIPATLAHIYCCLIVVACAWAAMHARGAWAQLRNVLGWARE